MELGGNMPGSLEARFAEAEKRKRIASGNPSEEDFEYALPAGDTQEAIQASEPHPTKSLEQK